MTKIVKNPGQERLVEEAIEQSKVFFDAAIESYHYALSEELDGKRAAEFLKAKGII